MSARRLERDCVKTEFGRLIEATAQIVFNHVSKQPRAKRVEVRGLETNPSHEPVPALELGVFLGLEVCLVVVNLADARDEVHLGELHELGTEKELVADCERTVREVSVRVPSK